MNKKLLLGFIAVFVTLEVTNFLVHGLALAADYRADALKGIFRPEAQMMSLMWVYHVLALVGSFFFVFIFSKGYEGKGIAEGIRYGVYIGIWLSMGMAYGSYAMIPMPYSLALKWFLYGIAQYLVMGIVAALVYGKKQQS
jgi:hypothetical protein